MSKARNEALKFGEALAELEEILSRIESEEIDIDELATELEKASELLELCRGKIRKAELEVTQIVQSIEGDTEASHGEEETADEEIS